MVIPFDLKKHGPTTYYAHGSKNNPPLVFLHGVGLNASMWRAQVETFKKDYFVVCPNFLGHGGSDNPPGERTLDDLVNQILDLVNHFGFEKIALVGFSLGGLTAQRFACDHPQRLSKLIILNAIYQRTAKEGAGVKARYEQTVKLGPMANVENALQRWFTDAYRESNPDMMDEVRDMFKAHKDDGYRKAYRIFSSDEQYITAGDLQNISCPALVTTGEGDVGSNPRMSRAMAQDIANAECHIVQAARHMAPVENASAYNKLIADFLKSPAT